MTVQAKTKILVEDIQKMFPNPKSNNDAKEIEDYCVGGAFLRYIDCTEGFPGERFLALKLQKVNLRLSYFRAHEYACGITINNDKRKFETAWRFLANALAYPNKA